MFLVAGLAVAGLAGIAAAFYFSIRSGNRRDKRLQSAGAGRAGAGRAGTGRRPGSGSGTARPGVASQAVNGARPVTTFTPAAVSSRNSRAAVAEAADSWPDNSRPEDSWSDDLMPGDPAAAGSKLGAATDPKLAAAGAAAGTARARRRVGFRKGADLDEELWPTETFGGVSDEQFWDDLASDKPLATTARPAQPDASGKKRPSAGAPGTKLGTGPAADPQAVQAQADDRKRDDRTAGRSRRAAGTGTYAAPRTGPDPAAERTAIQPAYAATQPVQSMKSQLPGATQPVRAAASTSQPMSTAAQSREAATQQREAITQPREAVTQPTETRRRRPSSAEEDPLTSAAFSLRPSGPVDGRSSLRARNASADRYDNSSPYLYPAPTYGDSSSATQTMATPPYGQDYGYGRESTVPPAAEQRRHNGTGSHARPDGAGDGTRTTRQASPRHSYQPAGGYPGNGYQTGSYPAGGGPVGGYPGNGHRGNGHRAPYDPRDDYRR